MPSLKISIITVCFNARSDIDRTIESIEHQSYPNIEFLVIDGGSRDETVARVCELSTRLSFIQSQPDKGIYHAMNMGLARSTGDVVAFMNAGDFYVSPFVVEVVAEHLSLRPNVDVVYGSLEVRHASGQTTLFTPPPAEEALDFLIAGSLPHQATFARRRAFARSQLFNDDFRSHSDYEWFLKLATDPHVTMERLATTIASFGTGGASSELERGERERHTIQNANPVLSSSAWTQRRVEVYQNLYTEYRSRQGV